MHNGKNEMHISIRLQMVSKKKRKLKENNENWVRLSRTHKVVPNLLERSIFKVRLDRKLLCLDNVQT